MREVDWAFIVPAVSSGDRNAGQYSALHSKPLPGLTPDPPSPSPSPSTPDKMASRLVLQPQRVSRVLTDHPHEGLPSLPRPPTPPFRPFCPPAARHSSGHSAITNILIVAARIYWRGRGYLGSTSPAELGPD